MSNEAFARAKKSALIHLESMINFTATLEKRYPGYGFAAHLKSLNGIASKIKGSVRPALTAEEIGKIDKLRQQLTSHYKFKAKLQPLDTLCYAIAYAVFFDGTLNLDVAKIELDQNKFNTVTDITTDALDAIRKNSSSILAILSVMLLFAHRKETYYYNTKALLQTGIDRLHLPNYDLEQMCSLDSKVSRNTKNGIAYESDIEAIRNCIHHVYYEIKKKKGEYLVRFERHDMGYDFVREFTSKQFIQFFDDFYFYEILLGIIFIMNLNQALMVRYLVKHTI